MSSLSNTIQEPPSSAYEHVFAGSGQIQEDGWPGMNGISRFQCCDQANYPAICKNRHRHDATVLIQGERVPVKS